ncbi:MAG: hypothetical protein ACSLE0_22565 [Chitinophagaceae bacterium]
MMKTLKLLLPLLFIPMVFHAQKTLTGLWIGTLSNDSTTIRKDQSYEIALTQYKEKVYGYSRSTFIINDTLYFILKRVKGTIENEVCEVKDEEIVSHNFPRRPDKGVKMISTFRRNQNDSTWQLDGNWKTTETKKYRYYSISGKINLKSEPDPEKSKLFPHLEELNLANEVAFYKESKRSNQEVVTLHDQSTPRSDAGGTSTLVKVVTNPPVPTILKDEPTKTGLSGNKPPPYANKAEAEKIADEAPVFASIKKSEMPPSSVPANENKNFNKEISKPEILKLETRIKPIETLATTKNSEVKSEPKTAETAVLATLPGEKKAIPKDVIQGENKTLSAATFIHQRKTVAPQIVDFRSDSLELRLYDNGEIDGDTVSVLLNGELLLARQGLKASAIKKTIYIEPGSNEITLVLYAENLGKYPPNTGLLVVQDGEDVYQIRFSADLQQNASIVFRRKR